jgi:hypothetical protein
LHILIYENEILIYIKMRINIYIVLCFYLIGMCFCIEYTGINDLNIYMIPKQTNIEKRYNEEYENEYNNNDEDVEQCLQTDPENELDIIGSSCLANDISLGLVSTCTCHGSNTMCRRCGEQTGEAGLVSCDQSCGFDNRDCLACNIYYGSVCDCLKRYAGLIPGTLCFVSDVWSGPGTGLPPTWVTFLNSELITSTILNTGIENLYQMTADEGNKGWTFGLTSIDTNTQALALNSKLLRTRDQIHIHRCNKKTGVGSPSSYLGTLNPTMYKSFVKTSMGWYCKAIPKTAPVTPLVDVWHPKASTDFIEWYAINPSININILSIGLLTDSRNDYLWECIAESRTNTAEHIFC